MKLKTVLITCGVCLLPILLGIAVFDRLPAQIPIHWNLEGEIDNYASKEFFVFILPMLMSVLQLFCLFMLSKDPKSKNYSIKMFNLVIWIIPVMAVVLALITYAIVFGYDIAINVVVPMLLGILFIILGNYLPKCHQNYTVGFRLPWTLDDEDNWNKTNRLAGYIMVFGGFLIVVTSLFDMAYWAVLIFIIAIVIIPSVYSYLLYRNKIR